MRLGQAAFDAMVKLLNNEPAQSLQLATELVARESSGPAPSSK
jgi:DNA-binding LacI/PurR family transcriptional regulator